MDVNAAKTFLRKAIKGQRMPTKITLDGYAALNRAVADLKGNGELPTRVVVRSNKYRRIKQRLYPKLGLKSFRTAAVVTAELNWRRRSRKGTTKSAS